MEQPFVWIKSSESVYGIRELYPRCRLLDEPALSKTRRIFAANGGMLCTTDLVSAARRGWRRLAV
jgi:hypothetical protein